MLTLLPLSSKRGSYRRRCAKASSLNGLMIFLERADGLKRNSRPRSKLTRESGTHQPTKWTVLKAFVGLESNGITKTHSSIETLITSDLLFDLRVIDVGVIVTRATHLQEIFRNLGKKVRINTALPRRIWTSLCQGLKVEAVAVALFWSLESHQEKYVEAPLR